MYWVKMLDSIKVHKVALMYTHEWGIYSQTNQLGHFATILVSEIGVTRPLNIYWLKTFSIYKQVFISTSWSYSDMCTINTSQDIGKFRQLIVFLHNVDFLSVIRRKLDKIINHSWNGHPWHPLGIAQNAEKKLTIA